MADVTFVTNVDLANNELRNAKAQVLSADPTGVEGKFIYNSTDKQLKFYNGTAWVSGGAQLGNLSGQAAAFGQSAANGSAVTAARSDHYHALPAHNAAAHSAIKLSDLAAPAANLAMGGFKLTGLAAGTANGDSLRYEQVIGQFLALTGGTLSGDLTIDSGLSSTELVVSNGGGSGASLEVRGGVSNIKLGSNDLSPAYWNIKHDHSDSKRFSIERWDGTAKVDTVLSIDNTTGAITSTKTLAMGNNKITGVTAGAATGEVVTYEQVVGVYQPIDGDLTAIAALSSNGYARRTGTNTWTIDASIPQANVTSLTADLLAKLDKAGGTMTGNLTLSSGALINMGGAKVTGMGDGSAPTDAVTKQQLDAVASTAAAGLDVKNSVKVASTANVANLASPGAIDGVTLGNGERVLLKNQTTASQNGIYVWSVLAGTLERADDANSSAKVTPGMFCFVEQGTYADTGWVLTTDGPITLGTTALTFTQFSGTGEYVWGNGLSNSGSTINVGAGTGISVAADTVGIDTAVVPRKYSVTLSGTAASQTVTHNLGTQDVVVSVRRTADNVVVYTGVTAATTNTVTIDFATTVTANAYRVTVMA
jgi:hypothetical protein